MKTMIAGGICGFILSIVLPKVGIEFHTAEYWLIIVSSGVLIGLLVD